jgi:hypothetical protein
MRPVVTFHTPLVRLALLVFAAATPEFAQGLHFGVKAGVPITEYFETGQTGSLHGHAEYSAATRRYTVGVSAEWRLTHNFGWELDALFKRMGYVGIVTSYGLFTGGITTNSAYDSKGDSWDFPLMAKYRFGRATRPYVAGGAVVRYIGPIRALGQVTE